VLALEVLVGADGVVHLVAHERPQHLGRDRRVVGDAHVLAHVVAERRHHELVVGPGPLGQRRRLQAVRELVDGEAEHHPVEVAQQRQHVLGDVGLRGHGLVPDDAPLLGRRLVHPGEGGGGRLCRHTPIVAHGRGSVSAVDTQRLADVQLADSTGSMWRLGDFWAERPVVVVFLRHFG
jgi:hypothetical protein